MRAAVDDPAALLATVAMASRADEHKRYTFFFAPQGYDAEVFLCLSPERLCAVDDCVLTTEALAGTYPATYVDGGGAVGDDKTVAEHGKVTDFIVATLAALGPVTVQGRELLRMRDVVHFRQVLSVTAQAGSDGHGHGHGHGGAVCGPQLLQWAVDHLHPTPAVCGVPTAAARALILANEGFTRGLYASCCGAVTRRGGELMVGLRSATVHRDRVHVYAGAGLVPGSDAAAEWAEIGLKMGQYLRALRGVSARPALCEGFPTATCALMAVVVEEMLRQGVGTFLSLWMPAASCTSPYSPTLPPLPSSTTISQVPLWCVRGPGPPRWQWPSTATAPPAP